MKTNDRKARLEANISKAIGISVELTIRGERKFTFSTDEVNRELPTKISAFFGKAATVTEDHDEECGTCAYVEIAA